MTPWVMAALLFWSGPPLLAISQWCLQLSLIMLLVAWAIAPAPPVLPWPGACSDERG